MLYVRCARCATHRVFGADGLTVHVGVKHLNIVFGTIYPRNEANSCHFVDATNASHVEGAFGASGHTLYEFICIFIY